MAAAVSIKDVATRAGVSVGTVSNVLNRPELVAPETQERVRSAITALGFVRNESARRLRAGRSRMFGLVVLDVSNPFFTDVAAGAEEAATEAGFAVLLCNSSERADRESHHLELLEQQRVEGVLITPVDAVDEKLARLRSRGTPVVLVDRTAGTTDQCSVAVDDQVGGRLARDHLLERGHRRITYVGGPFTIRQVQDRFDGAQRAIATADLPADLAVIETTGLNVAEGRRAGAELGDLPARSRPTAVFCANDLLALGVLQEMTRRGLRAPDDIALVGYDDIDFAAAAAVPLSSVRQPRHELGRAAAELLISEAMTPEEHAHRQIVFGPELVIRTSSDVKRRAPAGRAPRSAEA